MMPDHDGPTFFFHSCFGGCSFQSVASFRPVTTPSRCTPRNSGESSGWMVQGLASLSRWTRRLGGLRRPICQERLLAARGPTPLRLTTLVGVQTFESREREVAANEQHERAETGPLNYWIEAAGDEQPAGPGRDNEGCGAEEISEGVHRFIGGEHNQR